MFLTVLTVVLNVVHVVTCLLMIVVILMQASKEGGGFGVAFGGAATETVFGSRAGNVLTKATITLASIFLVSTLALAKIEPLRARAGLAVPRTPAAARAPREMPEGAATVPSGTGAGESDVPFGATTAPAEAGESAPAPSAAEPSGMETSAESEAPALE